MSRNRTLAELRSALANQADIVGASARYTPTMLNGLLNQSIQSFRERISIETEGARYLTSTSGTLSVGTTSPYPFQVLDLSGLSPGLVRTFGVDIIVNGRVVTLEQRPFHERAMFGTQPSVPVAWAHFQTDKLAIMPAPETAYPYTVWYLPVSSDLSSDADTFDGVAGWEDFVVWDAFARLIIRDNNEKLYQQATDKAERIFANVLRGATKVSHAGGAHKGRDTFGAAWVGTPRFRAPIQAGGGIPSDSSVTNQMLADMPARRFKANVLYTNENPQDVPGSEAVGLLPSFAGFGGGVVPTGTGDSALFLSQGGWIAPTVGGTVTGLALSQLQNIPGPRVLGNMGPTGVITPLLGQQMASMIAVFTGSAHGFVPFPTGGSSGRVLDDSGQWVAQSGGGVSSGIANNQLLAMPPLSFKGNFNGTSGTAQDLTKQQAASLMPNFFQASGASRGFVVAPTGGAVGNVLSDSGAWVAQTGGGGGPTMLAAAPAGAVQYNGGSGFAGQTGFRYTPGSGLTISEPLLLPSGFVGFGSGYAGQGHIRGPFGFGIFGRRRDDLGDTRIIEYIQNLLGGNRPGLVVGGGSEGLHAVQVESATGFISLGIGGVQKYRTDENTADVNATLSLLAGRRLGVQQLALPDSVGDKLGAWTASGFANTATGVRVISSGMALSVGSGGPNLHASGIDMRSSDIRNVRRINNLDGIKVYGDLPDADANITAPSGPVFIVPLTVTASRILSAVPSAAEHGDIALIENRSPFAHSIYNTGTGMGAASGWIATLAPSGGVSIRFASGAWEFGVKYRLGGF